MNSGGCVVEKLQQRMLSISTIAIAGYILKTCDMADLFHLDSELTQSDFDILHQQKK